MHDILDAHQAIAWDMDHTLVDGPNSEFFRDYIKRHGAKRSFHVVTFRTGGWLEETREELASHGVTDSHIRSIVGVPDRLYYAHSLSSGSGMGSSLYAACGGSAATLAADAEAFQSWKALAAKKLGCTLLVDDLVEIVGPGCAKHGITLLDALTKTGLILPARPAS